MKSIKNFKNSVFYHSSEHMPEIPDESVGLVITSLPYWNVKDYSMNGWQDKKNNDKIPGQIGDISDYKN